MLFVGNLIPVKDPMLLLSAFAQVAATRPTVTLEFVGDGMLRTALEERITNAGTRWPCHAFGPGQSSRVGAGVPLSNVACSPIAH